MSTKKYRGTGAIESTDYKDVQYVGKTKSGSPITITLENAINMGNIDLTFAEKDDVVAEITFTATYDNTDEVSDSDKEPYTIECDDTLTGARAIMLGAGIFKINDDTVGLTRGGGKFSVEREFREINADGDRGPVKDRIVIDASKATLTLNTLEIISKVTDLYVGLAEETVGV